jgi:hypothetical protein
MTVLLGVVGVAVVLVVAISARRRALRSVRGPSGWRAAPSRERWDAALRALACASPELAYSPQVLDLRLLSDEELCQAWCASYEVVITARSARGLRLAAGERRSYLDELERRHPRAVEVWLAGATTAGSDPTPYLRRGFDDLHQEDR